MKSIGTLLIAVLLAASTAFAATDHERQETRLRNAGQVMSEVLNMPDTIPQRVLDRTECVIVIPSVLKAAFVVGGSYGRGAMVCRTGEDFQGPWGAPSMVALEGGSFGFQAGANATDFVFLVMNKRGATSLLHSKIKLGGDVTAAAGPVGRAAEADTDAYMRAEILTYSRARGLFAGVSLEGATLHPDKDGNEALYGSRIPARIIVRGSGPQPPAAAEKLVSLLDNASPHPAKA
ncbi:MAG TPA: lipid-binding SYLF domain-containing protein [Candidatus Limnocylindrales bacterium]|nr:lipid-binding SYLF domain-containing protein [Candidatus Limnocylindrales bacterium]